MAPSEGQRPRKRWFPWAIIALLILGGAGAAAWWNSRNQGSNRSVVLVVSGDTAGWIVPCGCTSNQSGGLLRRGTFIRNLQPQADVILADAGGAPGGITPYHQVKFEAILKGELAMGVSAHNLGGPEAALGVDWLRQVSGRLRVPFLSANMRDAQGEFVAEPLRIVEKNGQRIALAGVLSRRYARDGLQVDDPREALLKAVAGARGQYDSLVVLAYLPEEELRQLAARLPEADAIIGGPTGQTIAPTLAGPTLLASATNKGKFLVQLESVRKSPRATWTGLVVEMNDQLSNDNDQEANLRAYLAELGRRDFPAQETGFADPLPVGLPRDYRLSGNQSCQSCHAGDCKLWVGSKHAHAWQTLAERGYHVDSYCQQCHTTGYGLPGGFESASRSIDTRSVGCESCHGPSQAHARYPKMKTTFAARDQCVRCHDRENSPKFGYDEYWQHIRHGAPSSSENKPNRPDEK